MFYPVGEIFRLECSNSGEFVAYDEILGAIVDNVSYPKSYTGVLQDPGAGMGSDRGVDRISGHYCGISGGEINGWCDLSIASSATAVAAVQPNHKQQGR